MSDRSPEFVPLDVPPGIPIARPVPMAASPDGIPPGYARPPATRELKPLRAFLELLVLLAAFFVGANGAALLFHFTLRGLVGHDVRLQNLWVTMIAAVFVTTAALLMVRLDRRPLSSIGWTAGDLWPNVSLGLGVFICSYLALSIVAVILTKLLPSLPESSRAQEAIQQNLPPMRTAVLLPIMLFVAVWEEIVFRGFLLTRLKAILKSWWLAIPLGGLIFGVVHIYEGVLAVGLVAILGIILGGLFAWRKSLAPGIVFHLAHNLVMIELLRTISTNWH